MWEYASPHPLYLAIKQQWLLFTIEHTGVGWFRSGVSNDALRDARLWFLSYLCHRFHSGNGLEKHTWRQTIRDRGGKSISKPQRQLVRKVTEH